MEMPAVLLVGEAEHVDVRDAMALLQATSRLTTADDVLQACSATPPELILLTQSRPGIFADHDILQLREMFPEAELVAMLGSWCEGEVRTGQPWPEVQRLYWHEFAPWWQQHYVPHKMEVRGLVVLGTAFWERAQVLADVLQDAGEATLWIPPGHPWPQLRGARAGIWDGGQLDEHEEKQLASFCERMARDGAPVLALLDFPRRDCCDRAIELGAAAVLGKPWENDHLLQAMQGSLHGDATRLAMHSVAAEKAA